MGKSNNYTSLITTGIFCTRIFKQPVSLIPVWIRTGQHIPIGDQKQVTLII